MNDDGSHTRPEGSLEGLPESSPESSPAATVGGSPDAHQQPADRIATLEAEVATLRNLADAKSALAARAIASYQKRALHMEIIRQQNEDLARLTRDLKLAKEREVKIAHAAGMAEVASQVLHNVGNALNGVVVSVGMLRQLVERNKVTRLAELPALIERIDRELGGVLTGHAKGKKVVPFIQLLAQSAASLEQRMVEELTSLDDKMRHIETIISTQQKHARVIGLHEEVSPATVLDEAIELSALAFRGSTIRIDRAYEMQVEVKIERQKLMLILLNLLKNAREAVIERAPDDPSIGVRLRQLGENELAIAICDNGVGVAEADAEQIFKHGFTTKPNGHGFGLHSCANAAQQMGGSLTYHSPGRDRGTTFTLRIPFVPVAAAVAVAAALPASPPLTTAILNE